MQYPPTKTILYVGGFEMPDKNAAAHRVVNNAKVLRELGYNVVFVGITHESERVIHDSFQGFQYYSLPYPKTLLSWLRYLTSFAQIKRYAENLNDLNGMVFYNYQAIVMNKALRYCKKHGLFSIADITEWYMAEGKNPIHKLLKRVDTSLRMKRYNLKADGIITISKYLFEYYSGCGYTNIIQVPPLIDLSDTKWNGGEYNAPTDKIKLVFAGNSSETKDGLSNVIDAVSLFQNQIDLTIIGVDEAVLLSRNQKVELSENIHVLGRIPHNQCLEIIKSSHFQVFVRENNLVTLAGFPTKLGESLACGTPVITNLSSNIGEYLINEKNSFIICDNSIDSIRNALFQINTLDNQSLNCMREYCKSFRAFDYRNHIDSISRLVSGCSQNL